jgi:hypothetical protein
MAGFDDEKDPLPLSFGQNPDGTQGSKKGVGSVWPDKAIAAAPGLDRAEPFLTPALFKRRHLFGIPLRSPVTQETIEVRDLKDYIQRGGNQFELDTRVAIFPVVKRWRLPFDPSSYQQFIYLEVPEKPVQQVLKLAIVSASYSNTGKTNEMSRYPRGNEIYTIPNEWVEMGNASKGILNVNPINPAFSAISTNSAVAASGSTLMSFIGQQGWVPAYWNVEAVVGLGSMEGSVPSIVNEAVGLRATMLILDNLIPQFRFANQSLNIDGAGQSVSDNMYSLLQQKRADAEKDYDKIVNKIKAITSSRIFSSNL